MDRFNPGGDEARGARFEKATVRAGTDDGKRWQRRSGLLMVMESSQSALINFHTCRKQNGENVCVRSFVASKI